MKKGNLFAYVACLWLAVTDHSAEASSATKCNCRSWVNKTLAAVKKVPMRKARALIIASLATSCNAVPADLKAASRLRAKSKHAQALATAAAKILGPACSVSDPSGPATTVPADCERTGPEPANENVKADMRASDYLVFLALAKLWREQGIVSETSQRLLDTFELSAALWGEEQRHARLPSRKQP